MSARRSFAIDALPERAAHYRGDHALVVVDVFRATTVILTATTSILPARCRRRWRRRLGLRTHC
jgi:hypothetical protein